MEDVKAKLKKKEKNMGYMDRLLDEAEQRHTIIEVEDIHNIVDEKVLSNEDLFEVQEEELV